MNLKYYGNGIYVTWQRQGSNKMGNPVYIINIFRKTFDDYIYKINHECDEKADKYGNIKLTSYNVADTIESLLIQIDKKGE